MSTLKVNTIQDTSGGSSSTPAQIEQGRAKVWVNFDGTGTPAARDSYNVSSIADDGTGKYTINFSITLDNANFAYAIHSSSGNHNSKVYTSNFMASTTTSIQILCEKEGGDNFDEPYVTVIIFGDPS